MHKVWDTTRWNIITPTTWFSCLQELFFPLEDKPVILLFILYQSKKQFEKAFVLEKVQHPVSQEADSGAPWEATDCLCGLHWVPSSSSSLVLNQTSGWSKFQIEFILIRHALAPRNTFHITNASKLSEGVQCTTHGSSKAPEALQPHTALQLPATGTTEPETPMCCSGYQDEYDFLYYSNQKWIWEKLCALFALYLRMPAPLWQDSCAVPDVATLSETGR